MNAPNVRSVTVRLNAEVAKYRTDIKAAGRDTEDAFDRVHASIERANADFKEQNEQLRVHRTRAAQSARETDKLAASMAKLNTSTRLVAPGMNDIDRSSTRMNTSLERTGNIVDRTSGRLRLLGEAVLTLGPGLVPLGAVGAVGLGGLAGLFGAATLGALGLVAATRGVGDALKAVEKARLEPTVENLRAAEEAMSRISPEAREWVKRVQEVLPLLKQLRDTGAAGLFPGLTASIDDFERLEPILTRFMAGVGLASGNAVADVSESLASKRWRPFLKFLSDEAPDAITNVTTLVGDLAHGASELWMSFDPGNDAFIDWALDLADTFDRYASSREGREDIQAFLAYARENGPEVADFFSATADAITQIVQAAAPLGGPTLSILTDLLNITADLADSDLATPALAAFAAYAALNRVLLITAATQAKLTGSAAAKGGLAARGGLFGFISSGANTARTSVNQLGRDLGTMAFTSKSSAKGLEHFNAAAARTKSTLSGIGKTAGVVGALTLATTGAADSIGLTNTASLGLLGTLGGPWGAAVGAATGFLIDMSHANDEVMTSVDAVNNAIESQDLQGMITGLKEIKKQQDELGDGGWWDDFKGGASDVLSILGGGQSRDEALTQGIADSRNAIEQLRNERERDRAAVRDYGLAYLAAAGDVDALTAAIERQQNQARAARDAQFAWGQAVQDIKALAKDGSEGLNEFTEAGQNNYAALSSAGDAWAQLLESGKATSRDYPKYRQMFLDLADSLGVTGKQARNLADDLLAVPEKRSTDYALRIDEQSVREAVNAYKKLPPEVRTWIRANGIPDTKREVNALIDRYELTEKERKALLKLVDRASGPIDAVLARLRAYKDKSITISTTFKYRYDGRPGLNQQGVPSGDDLLTGGQGVTGKVIADGGDGKVSSDPWTAGRTANAASTTSFGQVVATRSADDEVERWSRQTALALKGLAGTAKMGGADFESALGGATDGTDDFDSALGDSTDSVERERKARAKMLQEEIAANRERISALQAEKQAIEDSITTLIEGSAGLWDSIREAVIPEIGSTDEISWEDGDATFDSASDQLEFQFNNAQELSELIRKLRKKGFDGPALAALLQSASIETIRDFANQTRDELAAFEQQYEDTQQLTGQVGNQAAAAVGVTGEIRELRKETRQLERELKELNRKQDHAADQRDQQTRATKQVGPDVVRGLNRSANRAMTGARRRNR